MKGYILFRTLTAASLVAVLLISALDYYGIIQDKSFAISSGILAVLATIFASFMQRPSDPGDLSVAADKMLLHYDAEKLSELKEAKEQEAAVRAFIDHKSDEIFYIRLRSYLLNSLEKKYSVSEIAQLVEDIAEVERKLDKLDVNYDESKLPERFKKFVAETEKRKSVELMMELVDAFPFLPFKRFAKLWIRLRYLGYGDIEIPKAVPKA